MSATEYAEWCKSVAEPCLKLTSRQFWVAPRYKMQLWMSLLPAAHLVVIPRGASGPLRAGWIDQFETALCCGMPLVAMNDLWTGIRLKAEGYFFREETFGHPGYTPSEIMARAIRILTNPGDTILEPFCGTGTTLRMAKDMGRKAIGIEIEEKYCEIGARRMEQEVLAL